MKSQLPMTVAGRLEFVATMLQGFPIYDDNDEPTGEFTEPMITKEQAREMLAEIDL